MYIQMNMKYDIAYQFYWMTPVNNKRQAANTEQSMLWFIINSYLAGQISFDFHTVSYTHTTQSSMFKYILLVVGLVYSSRQSLLTILKTSESIKISACALLCATKVSFHVVLHICILRIYIGGR